MPYRTTEDKRRYHARYWKKYYADPAKRRKHIARNAQRGRELKKRLLEITARAKNKRCIDCKRRYPAWVMQFDHLPGTKKVAAVANMVNWRWSIKKVMAEIRKCEVVCANCHAERTHARLGQ